MAKKLYVGNLSFETTEDQLRTLFAEHGEVTSVNIITDRETGRPRGFGFVEMEDDAAADKAIAELNEADFQSRNLKVNEARPRESRGDAAHRARASRTPRPPLPITRRTGAFRSKG